MIYLLVGIILYFAITFHNEKDEKSTAKFTNYYGNIIDVIDKMNSN